VITGFRRLNLSVSSSVRPIGCPETSAGNYYYKLRNFPEKSRSQETFLLEFKKCNLNIILHFLCMPKYIATLHGLVKQPKSVGITALDDTGA
jgi:hypothetical protein